MSIVSLCRRAAVLIVTAQVLASCGVVSAKPRYLGDSDPHKAVARAHVMPIQGVDVSKYQGDVNWRRARAAGIRFAYIKATEGGDYLDPNFKQNWNGAAAAGVERGAYHFVYWCRPANEQALWFMLNVPADPSALPPVLDLEWNTSSRTCPGKISPTLARAKIKTLLEAMWSYTGKQPIIYTDPTFYREVLAGYFTNYRYWLRSVAAEPSDIYGDRGYTFWQFTTTGRVPGIAGHVDRNSFNGTSAYWAQLTQGQTMEASAAR